MWLKKKRATHESGFGIDYRFRGTCFDVMLIYHDIEIDDFLNELGIERGFGAPIMISISGSEPKPCFIDPESSVILLPKTESESLILIQNVIEYIESKWMPFLLSVINRDSTVIDFICDHIKHNQYQGFSHPFWICLFFAKCAGFNYGEFEKAIKKIEHVFKDFEVNIFSNFDSDLLKSKMLLSSR